MASSQRPRLSLPPELGAIDEGWGEDEQPTVAHPSRIPTSPARPRIRDEVPLAPDLPIELADLGPDESANVTAVPEMPLDDYARRTTGAEAALLEAPPPPPVFRPQGSIDDRDDDDALELDLSKEAFHLEPQSFRPSELPTAPPPTAFAQQRERTETVPQRRFPEPAFLSRQLTTLNPGDIVTDPPPSFPATVDPYEFSGRFSSAPPDTLSNSQAMKDRFAMGDFSGALALAEGILRIHPSDMEAQSLATKCREVLHDMYASRIGDMSRVPQVSMSPDQIRWLSLDHRAGFMLSMIDGFSSVDDLLDVSGMQRLDALRILCALLDQKVIALR